MTSKKEKVDYTVLNDFLPFAFSSDGHAGGPLVFVGYGLSAPEANYDDYQGLDVKGKVVLMFKHEPRRRVGGKEAHINALLAPSLSAKVENAQAHGASAVIIVHDYSYHSDGEPDSLHALSFTNEKPVALPVVQVKREIVNDWLRRSGKHLLEIQYQIAFSVKPSSFPIDDLRLELEVELVRGPLSTRNVVAWLEGSDPELKNETVIIAAHYDHIGFGLQHSSDARALGLLHPGANDNASGVVAVLEIARALAESARRPKRSLLFLLFSGEEDGLQGAKYYVEHPLVPLVKTVLMINIAQVGVVDGNLVVYSALVSPGIHKIFTQIPSQILRLNLREEVTQGADHAVFLEKRVPTLWITGGGRRYYHTPYDTWDHLNYEDMTELTRFSMEAIAQLADLTSFPAESALALKDPPFLGIQPDPKDPYLGQGVLVAAVQPNSPADAARIQAGDRIIQCDGLNTAKVEDLKKCLRQKAAGASAQLKVVRGSQVWDVILSLGERSHI